MITQYRIRLKTDGGALHREDAYRLGSALLSQSPPELAAALHGQEPAALTQYLLPETGGGIWTVNLLGPEAQPLGELLEGLDRLPLRGAGTDCRLTEHRRSRVEDAEALFSLGAARQGDWTLCFETPTAFKSHGDYLILPAAHLLLQSLVKKWNLAFLEAQIEDEDGQGLDALAEGLYVRGYRLNSELYRFKGKDNFIPGFVGTLRLENRLGGFHRELADALLALTPYVGVGAKTAVGMGGVRLAQPSSGAKRSGGIA